MCIGMIDLSDTGERDQYEPHGEDMYREIQRHREIYRNPAVLPAAARFVRVQTGALRIKEGKGCILGPCELNKNPNIDFSLCQKYSRN